MPLFSHLGLSGKGKSSLGSSTLLSSPSTTSPSQVHTQAQKHTYSPQISGNCPCLHAKSFQLCSTRVTYRCSLPHPLSVGSSICGILQNKENSSSQEYWSGLPCPPPGDLANSGIKLESIMSHALAGRFLVAQIVKNLPSMQETWVQPLVWEDPLREGNGNPL